MPHKLVLSFSLVLAAVHGISCGGDARPQESAPPSYVVGPGATAIVADERGRAEVILPEGEAMLALLPTTDREGSYAYTLRAAARVTPAEAAAAPAPQAATGPALAPAALDSAAVLPASGAPAADERDFLAPAGRGKSGFIRVHAFKVAEGERSVFYSEETNDMVIALAAQVVNFVDRVALPEETAMFGPVPDVDANGKLILLATAAVNGYSSVKGEFTGGFFAAKDLDGRDGSNKADMLYLYLPRPVDAGGVYNHADDYVHLLEEVVVHELQHMINYWARLNARTGLEAAWLNEGLSHFAEEHFGFRRSNAIRAGYFLASPESTPLTGACATLAERGAAFLFVKYLAERAGDPLVLRRLVQSGLRGTENVARAVGRPFGEVLRDWSASLWRDNKERLKTETWSAGVTTASLPQAAPAFLRIRGPVTLSLTAAPGGHFQGSAWLLP